MDQILKRHVEMEPQYIYVRIFIPVATSHRSLINICSRWDVFNVLLFYYIMLNTSVIDVFLPQKYILSIYFCFLFRHFDAYVLEVFLKVTHDLKVYVPKAVKSQKQTTFGSPWWPLLVFPFPLLFFSFLFPSFSAFSYSLPPKVIYTSMYLICYFVIYTL